MAIGERSIDSLKGTWSEVGAKIPPSTGFIDDNIVAPQIQQTAPQPQEDFVVELLPSAFPDRWKNDFEGLAYLGSLQEEVTIPYHRFMIRTLVAGDKIGIIQLCKDYEGSVGYNRVYRAACVAAALDSVDDRLLVPSEKKVPVLKQKYDYVVGTWYEPIIDLLYQRINELELRSIRVMVEMGIMPVPTELAPIFAQQDLEAEQKDQSDESPNNL